MRKAEFDHVIAVAAQISGEDEIVVIGSQAILGSVAEPPMETAKAPAGWEDRLVRVEVPSRIGQKGTVYALCLEAHDLVLSKCAAGRERDWEFTEVALRAGIVELPRLVGAVEDLPLDRQQRARVKAMLEGIQTRLAP